MNRLLVLIAIVGVLASLALADQFYVSRDTGLNDGDAYDNQGAVSNVR